MGTASIVLLTLGIVFLIDAFIPLLFPKWVIRIGKKFLDKKILRKIGITEVIIGIILLLIGINV